MQIQGKCTEGSYCPPIKLGLDLQGGAQLVVGVSDPSFTSLDTDTKKTALESIVSTLRKRVDLLGVAESSLTIVGERISIQLPGIKDFGNAKSTIQKAAKLRFSFVNDNPPADTQVDQGPGFENLLSAQDGQTYSVETQSRLDGENLTDAFVGMNEFGVPEVRLRLNGEGQKRFTDLTSSQNRGRNVAIVLDGRIESMLQIDQPVTTEWVSISFGGEVDREKVLKEASQMSLVLKSGSLPYSIEILEERSVGPTLGSDQIQEGAKAVILSFALMAIFMVFWYRWDGLVGLIALFVNLVGVVVLLNFIGGSLTLPGIAALVLTAGMSVDASIIIFERMKDLKLLGLAGPELIKGSFQKVASVLFDSYFTNGITGAALIYFGSGPIRGFGVVLLIGIVNTFLAVLLVLYPFLLISYRQKKI